MFSVCSPSGGGGVPDQVLTGREGPLPRPDGGYLGRVPPQPGPNRGEVPSQVLMGEGYPARSRWGDTPTRVPTPSRVPPSLVPTGGYLARSRWGVPQQGLCPNRVPPGQVPMGGTSQVQGTPPSRVPPPARSWGEGTWPGPDGGYPDQGTPPPAGCPCGQVQTGGGGTRVGQKKEYLLHGGRYASCVHAKMLSTTLGETSVSLTCSSMFPGYVYHGYWVSTCCIECLKGSHVIPTMNLVGRQNYTYNLIKIKINNTKILNNSTTFYLK